MPPPKKPRVNFGFSPSPALSPPEPRRGPGRACCGCGGVPAVVVLAGGTDMAGCCWGGRRKAVMVVARQWARRRKLRAARLEKEVEDAGVVVKER